LAIGGFLTPRASQAIKGWVTDWVFPTVGEQIGNLSLASKSLLFNRIAGDGLPKAVNLKKIFSLK
jgi:hypothetical protein